MPFKKGNLREVRMKLCCTSGQEQADKPLSLSDANARNDKLCVPSEIGFETTLSLSFSSRAAEARFCGSLLLNTTSA